MGEERSKNRRGENVIFALMIWVSQWIGAIIACFLILAVRSEDDKTGMATLCGTVGLEGTTCGLDGNYHKMFLVEVIGTFLFVSVNVNIIYNNGSSEIILNAIIIGIALCLGIFIAAPTSGGAINPGVGLVQNIFQSIVNDIELKQITIHIFGPFTGGLLAGLFQLSFNVSLAKQKKLAEANPQKYEYQSTKVGKFSNQKEMMDISHD
jgi:glycerol uptake facilitator-like aquaporin